jgi:hypothetical protein
MTVFDMLAFAAMTGSNKTVPVTTENKPLDTEAMRNRGLLAAAREEVNAAYRELKPLVARVNHRTAPRTIYIRLPALETSVGHTNMYTASDNHRLVPSF